MSATQEECRVSWLKARAAFLRQITALEVTMPSPTFDSDREWQRHMKLTKQAIMDRPLETPKPY